ncbi:NADH-quinone oxidoreductase subunit NuoE [Holosporaceae bacterium 'Namur']|nr:NADH-quinone oxidoreductase subunit NuoE [Holosporaceae bacterium 'Namur']
MSSMFKEIEFEQPNFFEFTKENLKLANKIADKYPKNQQRSAIMPLLYLVQKQHNNWIPKVAMDYIASLLDIPAMQVYEVASFYTMYNKQPVGKHLVQICKTTPCWLRGSDEITEACKTKLGIDIGETTKDGKFTLVEVECLGACVNAPMVQINDDYYEDLTPELMTKVLNELERGNKPSIGSQTGRQCSSPKE